MGRFLLPLAVSALTAVTVDAALARGGPLHLFSSQSATVSHAGVPSPSQLSPNEFLSGCGHGRYREAATQRCRGPADVGN